MFSLRLFLLNHSPLYSWKALPPELRAHFTLNPVLRHAEYFIADAERGLFQFELIEEAAGEKEPVRHLADLVVLQSWGLLTLVRFGPRPESLPRFTGLRDNVIVSAGYVPKTRRRASPK